MQQTALAATAAPDLTEELRRLCAVERDGRLQAEEQVAEVRLSLDALLDALVVVASLRGGRSGTSTGRAAEIALAFTRRVAPELAADDALRFGYLLHDVGNVGVPDAILLKPGPLDSAEFEEMRRHTTIGASILEGIPFLSGVAREVVLSHHERWDGQGYPRGLREAEIPLAARIFAIAGAYDAMTQERPYRRPMSSSAALAQITSGAKGQFDPALVRAFVLLADELLAEPTIALV
jgi:HD-GYP domain-containing protein (c-di-GMP phosphodiesterase class II)